MVKCIKIGVAMTMSAWFVLLSSCEKAPEPKPEKTSSALVSKAITPSGGLKKNKSSKTGNSLSSQASNIETVKTKPLVSSPTGEKQGELVGRKTTVSSTGKAVPAYDYGKRVDPFVPLIQKKDVSAVPAEAKNTPKRILTPLEKLELSQIKLVAVVLMDDKQLAMVEESSGKGYEVTVGTYMGRNGGQVSAISRDRIVVKEYVKDYQGKRKERFQEIKFHQNKGGE